MAFEEIVCEREGKQKTKGHMCVFRALLVAWNLDQSEADQLNSLCKQKHFIGGVFCP